MDIEVLIEIVKFFEEKMIIKLNTKKELIVPYTYTEKLASAILEDIKDYRLI